jgi:hypothetical protein
VSYVTTKHWLDLLRGLPPAGAILHASSLRLLAGLDEKAGRQACWRLTRAGLLTHLGQGWYTHAFAKPSIAEAAHLLVAPSYVSLETVLVNRGVTTQPSVFHQCVTLQPTQQRRTPLGEIHYRHVTRELFFGFRPCAGPSGLTYFEADAEKALLDLIYLSRREGDQVWLDLDFGRLDAGRLAEYAARFPASVRGSLEELRETRVVMS